MHFQVFKPSWPFVSSRFVVFVMASIVLTGCSSTGSFQAPSESQALTAITDSPTNDYHPGQFVWFDLLTPDAPGARAFYGELFGWTFQQEGRYTMISNKGHRIAGILEVEPQPGERGEPLWLGSLSVNDVEKAAAFVAERGGKVLKGPMDMQKRGRGALVSDPQGAQLILLRAAGGDPVDDEPETGDWVWNEIWSNQPLATSSFYRTMGGYDSIKMGEGYEILLNKGSWHAGIRPVAKDNYRTRWVPAVRVESPEALLDRVEALGGVVWLRPDEAPSNGDTALISDSAGALLMIQRWSAERMEEAQ